MSSIEKLDTLLMALRSGERPTLKQKDFCPIDHLCARVDAVVRRADMNSALSCLRSLLPGWGWRGGTCWLSDDAFVFADFNCPVHGERLRATVPEKINGEEWAEFTDIDYRPAGNPARALLISTLVAYRELCLLAAMEKTG